MLLGIGDIILLFAVLQTLWLAAVLLAVPGKAPAANWLLAALLLALALILLELVLVSSPDVRYAALLGFSLPAYFLLAPLYYLHARVIAGRPLRPADARHFLSVLAGVAACSPFLLLPAHEKQRLVTTLLEGAVARFPLLAIVVLSLASFVAIAYFYRAWELLERVEHFLKEQSASAGVAAAGWLGRLSLVFCCFMLLFYLAAAELFFLYPYRSATPFLALFGYGMAAFVFLVSWQSYRRPELFALHTPGALPQARLVPGRVKYEKNLLNTAQLQQLERRLLACMEQERPYLDGELRLADLAARLHMPAHHLSQLINTRQQCSFFDFINRHRLRHAMQLLVEGGAGTMLDVALASGFNSKASFNRVFRRETGTSPSAWLQARGGKESGKDGAQLAR